MYTRECDARLLGLSTAAEKENGNLFNVKVEKACAFMCDITAEVATDNTVPRRLEAGIKLLLKKLGHITF